MVSLTLDTPIRLAVQVDLLNKPDTITGSDGKKTYPAHIKQKMGYGWQTTDLTIGELRKHILSGFAFCTAALASDHRKADNFQSAWGILIDLDHNSILQGRNDPVLGRIATAAFTTPSHTTQNPRSKFLCVFDRPVTDASLFTRYTEALMKRIETVTVDTSGKDATRFSFGNQSAQWAFYGNGLSVDWLNEIVAQDAIHSTQSRKIETPAQPDNILSYEDIRQRKQSNTWLSENARRIADTLGVTEYGANGYSNEVSCPCPLHNRNDASPSAGWHRDTYHLHCFASGKNYTLKQTAAMLGIELDSVLEHRRGLYNNTREWLLQHTVLSDTGRKKQPLQSFCRFTESVKMYAIQSGWYTIAQLQAETNGLFSDRTLRYSIANNLISSDDYHKYVRSEGDKGIFCNVVTHTSSTDISYCMVDITAKNKMFVPPPPENNGRGNRTYYYVTSEESLQNAAGIEKGGYQDWINLADLQSNDSYTAALNRVLIEQRPGVYTRAWLGKRLGLSGRTIRRYVKKDSTLNSEYNETMLGTITDVSKVPVSGIGHRFIDIANPETGELKRHPYNRSVAERAKRLGLTMFAGTRTGNKYTSKYGRKLSEDTQELDKSA